MIRAVLALIITLTVGILAAPPAATAQSGAKIPKIGILQVGTEAGGGHLSAAFKQEMRERGYVEGQRVLFEQRFGGGKRERLSEAASELVRLKVDIIVTSTDEGIAAVKQQTQTIPIVMANSTDPVGTGFVVSLARPGRNITGNSSMSPELNGKRLELLKEVVPGLSRVAILWNPDIRGAVLDYKETEGAARTLRLQLQSVEVTRADELDRAFAAMTAGRAEGLGRARRESPRVHEPERNREARAKESVAVPLRRESLCRRRGSHRLRAERGRSLAAGRHLCRQDPQGGQAG